MQSQWRVLAAGVSHLHSHTMSSDGGSAWTLLVVDVPCCTGAKPPPPDVHGDTVEPVTSSSVGGDACVKEGCVCASVASFQGPSHGSSCPAVVHGVCRAVLTCMQPCGCVRRGSLPCSGMAVPDCRFCRRPGRSILSVGQCSGCCRPFSRRHECELCVLQPLLLSRARTCVCVLAFVRTLTVWPVVWRFRAFRQHGSPTLLLWTNSQPWRSRCWTSRPRRRM